MKEIAEILGEEPNWLVTLVIGTLLPLLIAGLVRIASGLISRFFSKSYLVLGTWYLANSSAQGGKSYTTKETWKIYRNVFGNTKVIVKNDQNPYIKYKGNVSIEGSHAIITYYASKHTETVNIRLYLPPTPNTRLLSGLWLSHDYDGIISSGIVSLSQDPFTERAEQDIWKEKSKFKDFVLSVQP